MRKALLFTLSAISISVASGAYAKEAPVETLPVPYEDVFSQSMNDPNVMVFHADKAFRNGDYAKSLKWMLKAAEYEHPAAISNAKYMIEHNKGTVDNRESVVDFLRYYAEPRGDQSADLFARMYLADFYRGDKCVWFAPQEKSDCAMDNNEPMAGFDLRQSYYYYDGAAEQGDARSIYTSAMMNILGLGVPRNVPLGMQRLRKLAETGSVSAAHIIAEIYQQGFWMPQDRMTASKWLEKPVQVGVPAALLQMGQNLTAGHAKGEELERMHSAVTLYERVINGVLASAAEKAEASYRLAMIKDSYAPFASKEDAHKLMMDSVVFGRGYKNEFSVNALMWLGDKAESSSLKDAVVYYKQAIAMLEGLPLNIQQRHAASWQKVAYAYASGQGTDLPRDERKFSEYMNRHHNILAKTFIPDSAPDEFAGYTAFNFPG